MNNNVFSFDELIERTSVPPESLHLWEQEKLLIPLGHGENNEPFYGNDQLDRALHIQKLQELGYNLEEIRKIIRKVGLPSTKESSPISAKGSQYLTVGNLAERIGTSPRTIKHWEEKGIIEPDMRSQGGFRLYRDYYVFLCELIKDLQLFGYSLEQIKTISDYFRLFIQIKDAPEKLPPQETENHLEEMLEEIEDLFEKIRLLKQGINRWEDLVKKKKKDIQVLRVKNMKRIEKGEEV